MSQTHVMTPPNVDQPAEREWTDDQRTALRLWVTLARCHATYSKAIASKVQDYGLTTPQFGTLEALYHLGPLTLGELADKLLVTGGNVTYVMDRLEDQGLVYLKSRTETNLLSELPPARWKLSSTSQREIRTIDLHRTVL